MAFYSWVTKPVATEDTEGPGVEWRYWFEVMVINKEILLFFSVVSVNSVVNLLGDRGSST